MQCHYLIKLSIPDQFVRSKSRRSAQDSQYEQSKWSCHWLCWCVLDQHYFKEPGHLSHHRTTRLHFIQVSLSGKTISLDKLLQYYENICVLNRLFDCTLESLQFPCFKKYTNHKNANIHAQQYIKYMQPQNFNEYVKNKIIFLTFYGLQ